MANNRRDLAKERWWREVLKRQATSGRRSCLERKKRPPERLCPRGAEDSNLFRERLDVSRGHAIFACRDLIGYLPSPPLICEADRRHPCQRRTLRGPQESRSSTSPVQTHPHGLSR